MSDGSFAVDQAATTRWYCVYTKPRAEDDAIVQLRRQSFECFLPRMRSLSVRRGKRVRVIEPMFPRYLFLQARVGHVNLAPVRSTRSVVDFVRFGGVITAVPDDLVEALMRDADENGVIQVEDFSLNPGDRVRVVDGPLIGMEGVFSAATSEQRVIVLMSLLGQQQTVSLRHESLQRIDARKAS